ncbi:hypothetical protein HPG69_013971 [Diceros bicornis minor]|uniref:Uncharacterized protein n=1 Tax=Diceros bicornis minor TaxID=77932 RepID=A0A7J7EMX0_DICBM|nr:hypothetical protein HPG69_013971 [Diceros bicornis minor]
MAAFGITVLLNAGLLLFPDVACLGLMIWTSGFMVLILNPSRWLVIFIGPITLCFPTVSPYILMSHDRRVFKFFRSWIKAR